MIETRKSPRQTTRERTEAALRSRKTIWTTRVRQTRNTQYRIGISAMHQCIGLRCIAPVPGTRAMHRRPMHWPDAHCHGNWPVVVAVVQLQMGESVVRTSLYRRCRLHLLRTGSWDHERCLASNRQQHRSKDPQEPVWDPWTKQLKWLFPDTHHRQGTSYHCRSGIPSHEGEGETRVTQRADANPAAQHPIGSSNPCQRAKFRLNNLKIASALLPRGTTAHTAAGTKADSHQTRAQRHQSRDQEYEGAKHAQKATQ